MLVFMCMIDFVQEINVSAVPPCCQQGRNSRKPSGFYFPCGHILHLLACFTENNIQFGSFVAELRCFEGEGTQVCVCYHTTDESFDVYTRVTVCLSLSCTTGCFGRCVYMTVWVRWRRWAGACMCKLPQAHGVRKAIRPRSNDQRGRRGGGGATLSFLTRGGSRYSLLHSRLKGGRGRSQA